MSNYLWGLMPNWMRGQLSTRMSSKLPTVLLRVLSNMPISLRTELPNSLPSRLPNSLRTKLSRLPNNMWNYLQQLPTMCNLPNRQHLSTNVLHMPTMRVLLRSIHLKRNRHWWKEMSQPNKNNQTTQKLPATTPKQGCQPYIPRQPLTEERIKEIITETLITLNLLPAAQKKKAITNV